MEGQRPENLYINDNIQSLVHSFLKLTKLQQLYISKTSGARSISRHPVHLGAMLLKKRYFSPLLRGVNNLDSNQAFFQAPVPGADVRFAPNTDADGHAGTFIKS
jgi:hypothetical protein